MAECLKRTDGDGGIASVRNEISSSTELLGMLLQRELAPEVARERVDDERIGRALDVLEPECRSPLAQRTRGDLGDFEVRVDLHRNAMELPHAFQIPGEVAERVKPRAGAGGCHSGAGLLELF